MNISSLLSPDTPRGRLRHHRVDEHNTPEVYSTSDVPIQAPSPIHPLNQAALWEANGYDVESVEKAMSKSSSSSSGMGGYYDPIHDHESTAQLSPRARRIGMNMLVGGDAYNSVQSNMSPPNHYHGHHIPTTMGAPSHHHTSHQVTPLGPPPVPHQSQQQHQHQHHISHQYHSTINHHHGLDTEVKPAYPNVLNELSAQNSYSTASYYTSTNGLGEPPRSEQRTQWSPVQQVISPRQPHIVSQLSPQKRRKRVWEEDPSERLSRGQIERSLSPLRSPIRSPSPIPPPPSPPQPEPEFHIASLPQPDMEPESTAEMMEQDNVELEEPHNQQSTAEEDHCPNQEPSDNVTFTEEDHNRIQELRILLEKYPLYKAAHLELIALLRRKNTSIASGGSQSELESARTYASEQMQLGEEEWLRWLQDESAACESFDLEGIMKVIDLCAKSVEEQPISVNLWENYVAQVEGQYRLGHETTQNGTLSAEEAEIKAGLAEMFTRDMLLGVYAQAVDATRYHLLESHRIWDKYLEMLLQDLELQYSDSKLEQCRNAFLTRIKTPHSNIDQTFSAYSTFVTRYENANYEKIMVAANKSYAQSKGKYDEREIFEIKLRRAIEATTEAGTEDNANNEWYAWQEYLQWELALPKRKQDIDLICALFERCVMRYDYRGDVMWEWYLDVIAEKANRSPNVLPILERATKAFPALPSFWSRYLVAMEARFKPLEDIQAVKDRAVHTVSKIGESALLDVCYTWASISKRKIIECQATLSDGERNALIAEMKIYMKEFQNLDAEARLDRLYVALCTQLQKPDLDSARKTWKSVVANELRAKSSKLWLSYYQWELRWGTRQYAAGVLRLALSKAANIDDPTTIFETYATHVAEWGDINDAEEYYWRVRKWREKVPVAVAQPMVQPAEAQQETALNVPTTTVAVVEQTSPNKRRRSIGGEDGVPPYKKSKASVAGDEVSEAVSEQSAVKRDRENATAVVKKLPADIKELRLREFFRDCGAINSIKLVTEKDGETATATIEFESREDVLSAQTKDMKSIDGHEIEVAIGSGLTLYVTNFPPSADENYIRDLFKEYGEIVDVRFPSLKYNTHRRFCYVQFLSAESARAATKLDGMKLGQKETLVAKISDPLHKQERSGAVYDGRELFLRNIDFKATESDIKALFEREFGEGSVETVRLPSKIPGRHQGFGFVVLNSKDDAEKAVELNNTLLLSRPLNIRLSELGFSKKPDSGIVGSSGDRASTPMAMSDHPSPASVEGRHPPPMEVIQRKTLAILNLPDTVNDTRLRELFEKHGTLRKVQLRPEYHGAVIEYEDVKDAGKAGLALEGYKFPGMTEGIKFGTMQDLKRQVALEKDEKKKEKSKGRGKDRDRDAGKDSSVTTGGGAKAIFGAPMQALRSSFGASAARGQKRRGGLGFVGGFGRGQKEEGSASVMQADGAAAAPTTSEAPAEAPKAKSNADFRSMFLKK